MNTRKTAAIIVAAGEGTRLPGDRPKAYRLLEGKPLWRHSYDLFKSHPQIQAVLVVCSEAHQQWMEDGVTYAVGGATRQQSVYNGLLALQDAGCTHVLIHDAARPSLDNALVNRVIQGLQEYQAVIPVLPVKETIKHLTGNGVVTPDRNQLYTAQTPQGFDYNIITRLHREYCGKAATDDALLAEWAGIAIHFVEGNEQNIKITTPKDLPMNMETRTGMGFDVHSFVPHDSGNSIKLCGIDVPCAMRLEGHSDADVGLHALTDAMLGAMALGDIGMHFPPSDPEWKGMDSSNFLAHANQLLQERNAHVTHADITIICQQPKVSPYRDAMRIRIAQILSLDANRISVKATTTEGLGFTGRSEGIAAQAIVTVRVQT